MVKLTNPCLTYLLALTFVVAGGCAQVVRVPDQAQLGEAVRARTGHSLRSEERQQIPSDVNIDDGLTRDEAVAIALWNSPGFQVTLADLGLARAELVDAGLLRNPVLALLFPVGPKQLEWTVQYPVDIFWQRPRRIAAARLNVQAVSERLVSQALSLVADVKIAHAESIAAEQRVALAVTNAQLARQVADITDARLRAGDISDLEARAARSDYARLEVVRRALEQDRDVAKVTLVALLGIDTSPEALRLTPSLEASPECDTLDVLIRDALASRPDVRAAEISIESAAQRARWERSRALNLIAMLDFNGSTIDGVETSPAETGPGFILDTPLFSRNQGGISRAIADVERASRSYIAVRSQVLADVRTSAVRLQQARQAVDGWRREIVPELQIEQRQAESAYRAGEVPLLALLDAARRLVEARTRELEAVVSLEKALVTLERSVGRACGS